MDANTVIGVFQEKIVELTNENLMLRVKLKELEEENAAKVEDVKK